MEVGRLVWRRGYGLGKGIGVSWGSGVGGCNIEKEWMFEISVFLFVVFSIR